MTTQQLEKKTARVSTKKKILKINGNKKAGKSN